MGRNKKYENNAEKMRAYRAAKQLKKNAGARVLTKEERRGVSVTIERECANYDTVSRRCIAGGTLKECYCIGADGCINCRYFFDHVLPFARLHRDTATLAEDITGRCTRTKLEGCAANGN